MSEYIIIGLAIIGFFLSFLIWYTKNNNKKLVCVIGKDCDKVIKSEYSVTFGIKNEVLGMLYYTFLIIVSIAILLMPYLLNINFINIGRIIISGFSAAFSIYLTYIQIFVLKEYCEYCLATALVNIIVFLVILF